MYNFDPYNVLLAIATNIPVLLMTAFVLQGHIYDGDMKMYFTGKTLLIKQLLTDPPFPPDPHSVEVKCVSVCQLFHIENRRLADPPG